MAKEQKNRAFESEALILPALKMVLAEAEDNRRDRPTKKAKRKSDDALNEEIVMRIIDKLNAKD